MNIYWFNPPISPEWAIQSDLAWMNYRIKFTDHHWIQPIFDWRKYVYVEDIIEHITSNNTEILCISTYVWNHKICHLIAKEAKKKNPNIIVIQGGPHQGHNTKFFEEHPYVDYLCYATGHGEDFLVELLPQLSQYGKVVDANKIPHLISRDHISTVKNSKFGFSDLSIMENNMDYIIDLISTAEENKVGVRLTYETTRGCPYSCTYCEWGGGIGGKVSAKSMETIKKDIDLMSMLKIQMIDIVDANFGILDRDLEIIDYLRENKKKYGYPKTLKVYGLAKVKRDKKEKILDRILSSGLTIGEIGISLQSLDPAILKNIKRTDLSTKDNLDMLKKFKKKYPDRGIFIEFIMGLPGYTLNHFYEEMDIIQETDGWKSSDRYVLYILPDSEINSEFQRRLHKIQSVKVATAVGQFASSLRFKSLENINIASPSEIVVSSYSYTKEDWKQMYFMNLAMTVLGPNIPKKIKASIYMPKMFNYIKDQEWYTEMDQWLDNIVNDKMESENIEIFKGTPILEYLAEKLKDIKWN
jgi:tRNA A37 methylthiotransferase MiaB